MKLRQPSLAELLSLRMPPPLSGALDWPEVYDFFAGAGGFSEGARQAGCKVVYACDNDPLALQTHAANHPATEHCLTELPLPRRAWPFPTDGRSFHVHFSPPCQKFSMTNTTHRIDGDRGVAKALVKWCLKTALACGAQTWSLEQVPSSAVVALVETAKRRHPGRVAYASVDFSHLGVPQTRKRLIAGSPALVARLLRRLDRTNLTSVRSAIAKPRGTHVRNSKGWVRQKQRIDGRLVYTKAKWSDHCQSIEGPAPTVLARRELSWVTPSGSGCPHAQLNTQEIASLQTFPANYRWPESAKSAMRFIGNAVPPLVAKLMLEKN